MEVWFWCLHCERVFPVNLPDNAEKDEFDHWEGKPEECAYPGCDGGLGDIREWESVRKHNPEYPETPARDEKYGLFGDVPPGEPVAPPGDFYDVGLGENEFWCVTLQGAAKLLDISPGKVRIRLAAGRLTKIPASLFGKDLIPLPEIAEVLEQSDSQVLEKAAELELKLTMCGGF